MAVTTFHLFFVVAFVALHVVCGMDEMIIWMTMLVVEDVVLVSSGVKWKWHVVWVVGVGEEPGSGVPLPPPGGWRP